MFNEKDMKKQAIIEEFHRCVAEKSKRCRKTFAGIKLENAMLQLLAEDYKLSPAACCKCLVDKFGFECDVEAVVQLYRNYYINNAPRRAEVFADAATTVIYLQKALAGDINALKLYQSGYRSFLESKRGQRRGIYSHLLLAVAAASIPQLLGEKERGLALGFNDTFCKYLLYDLHDVIEKAYSSQKRESRVPGQGKAAPAALQADYENLKLRLSQTEKALEQSNMLLGDLQEEFDERLASVRLQELTEFFAKLNSEKYGCILDQLLELRVGMAKLRDSGCQIPLELNGLLILVKKLIQFMRDNHIDPQLQPGSLHKVKAADIEFWQYEGSPFAGAAEEKQIRVISPGWIYSEKQVQISRPKVKEEKENVD
ncbi:MAG: hypothetical protein Q4E64_10310 [Phascolarctobacterium sp.]|uniref:hypothetical protein n=1 Tax=Phascolarctobacterium sp. TaxID=2049039 RepID=UPI0026DB556A|nr:hypothetical protein [Phascolarctobacterium sp.]MDO4922199.1 hypothetical protein [Phascolarctobacterium sp.]